MSVWFLLALMTAAAVFAVLWPLGRRPPSVRGEAELAVYRDQLDEVERDRRAEIIGPAEAEAARVEIGRRLIAAADSLEHAAPLSDVSLRRRRAAAVAACMLVPLAAGGLYAAIGSPQLPSAPLAERAQAPVEGQSIAALVARVEAHLEANPQDGRGWEVLAPVYLRLGRFDDAVRARRNALRLNGLTGAREADLGEALVYAANGVVTGEAKDAFDRALKLDPGEVKARYFHGLAAEQDGDRNQAATIWRTLLADAPAGAPWAEVVRTSLARVDASAVAGANGPTNDEIAAAEQMSPQARAEMVRGMVERLAARLRQDGSDLDGWVRLVRAYMVLGDRDRARSAAADARNAAAGDEQKLRRLDELIKTLGLET